MDALSLEELAIEANVDADYVRRLIDLGALPSRADGDSYDRSEVRRVELLRSWEAAGLSSETLADLVQAGELSASWLDAAVTSRAERLDLTYEQLCRAQKVPFALIRALQSALGFAPPDPHDHAREGDPELAGLLRTFSNAGVPVARTLGVVRVYADSLRRVANAEAQLYESEFPRPLQGSAWSEEQSSDYQAQLDYVVMTLERALLAIYRRQREHACIEHCISHAELALDRAGLQDTVRHPAAICFVDLTGYTHITEERGDEVAAHLATQLTSLVEDVALCHAGKPIRWLGDGGMFHFKNPTDAVVSGLDIVERAPTVGLPPMHIGIHAGPVVFQDGDVYGTTVNVASRIASYAGAGEVLASAETVAHVHQRVHFEALGTVRFKGLSRPVELHRAVRVSGRAEAHDMP